MLRKARVQGRNGVIAQFRRLLGQTEGVRLSVGYEAPYAIHVHEDMEARHRNGQAKFLEQPLRTEMPAMAAGIRARAQAGMPLEENLYIAGQQLLDASKPLVPVRTGFLRDSGFVRVE